MTQAAQQFAQEAQELAAQLPPLTGAASPTSLDGFFADDVAKFRCSLCRLPSTQRQLVSDLLQRKLSAGAKRSWRECLAFLRAQGIVTSKSALRTHAIHIGIWYAHGSRNSDRSVRGGAAR